MKIFKNISLRLSVLGRFWQEKINYTILRWNLLFIIASILLLFFVFNDLPPQAPLYYSLPWGADRLVSSPTLFILPSFSIVVLVLNNFIAQVLSSSSTLLSRLLVIVSLVFSLLSFISLLQIILLVT